jgi:CheY-like chemotaxis protein
MPEGAGILADKTQLEQILMNLVINAQDAIDDTGRITIETTRVTLDEPAARLHADLLPGTYIMLTVSDTGHGIDQQTLGEIFEPFFTTKGPDKGTGLGLATVHGIVRQHGGTIGVQSESGKGTTFTVYFPFFGQATPLLPETPEQLRIRGDRTGSILLVEDNETVRQLVHDLLAGDGYEVVEALNPQQALELAHDKEIDLLVTDVVMPGMSGLELHKQLLTTNPGIKALFMSGYTGTAISEQNKLFSSDTFIQKPFTVDTMLNKVASILGIPS